MSPAMVESTISCPAHPTTEARTSKGGLQEARLKAGRLKAARLMEARLPQSATCATARALRAQRPSALGAHAEERDDASRRPARALTLPPRRRAASVALFALSAGCALGSRDSVSRASVSRASFSRAS